MIPIIFICDPVGQHQVNQEIQINYTQIVVSSLQYLTGKVVADITAARLGVIIITIIANHVDLDRVLFEEVRFLR